VVFGSLSALVLQQELYPFSHFPLYGNIRPRPIVSTELRGLTPEGDEVPLSMSALRPLGKQHVGRLFRRLAQESRQDQQEIVAKLQALYEDSRRENLELSPLGGIRCYRLVWEVDWQSVTTSSEQQVAGPPDRRELISEVTFLPSPRIMK
jgi:hypothetical protein